LDGVSLTDLLRDFSESPITAVSLRAEGTPLAKGRWATGTLNPCPRSKSMKKLLVPHWSRVVSDRGIRTGIRAIGQRVGMPFPPVQ